MIYFDNASSSFPKAEGLSKAIADFYDNCPFNIARGTYMEAYNNASSVIETRELVAKLIGADNIDNIVFSSGATESINLFFRGLLKSGDHVIICEYEHNSAYRTVEDLKSLGIEYDILHFASECDISKIKDVRELKKLSNIEDNLKNNTRAIFTTFVSNTSGAILPIEAISALCENRGIIFGVDLSMSIGYISFDLKEIKADFLCFSSHYWLHGPMGLGVSYISNRLSKKLKPLITGGTGSMSSSSSMPEMLPDKFEAGSLNVAAIIGLRQALKVLESRGVEDSGRRIRELSSFFIDESSKRNLPIEISDYSRICKNPSAIISFKYQPDDSSILAFRLDTEFKIKTRVGLQCSYLGQVASGGYPDGTIRISFSSYNTIDEVKELLFAIEQISSID